MSETLLLIARHAETMDNVHMRLSGWTDSHLSIRGEIQSAILADHFQRAHDVRVLYASPLTRARRTAEAIAIRTRSVLVIREDLREMHFGAFDGWPLERIARHHPELLESEFDLTREFAWPGGESRTAFARRVRRAIDLVSIDHPGDVVGIVTHGGVISYFLTMVAGRPVSDWRDFQVPNASLTEVLWDPVAGSGSIVRHGDDGHLIEMLPPQG